MSEIKCRVFKCIQVFDKSIGIKIVFFLLLLIKDLGFEIIKYERKKKMKYQKRV